MLAAMVAELQREQSADPLGPVAEADKAEQVGRLTSRIRPKTT